MQNIIYFKWVMHMCVILHITQCNGIPFKVFEFSEYRDIKKSKKYAFSFLKHMNFWKLLTKQFLFILQIVHSLVYCFLRATKLFILFLCTEWPSKEFLSLSLLKKFKNTNQKLICKKILIEKLNHWNQISKQETQNTSIYILATYSIL